MTSGDTEGYGAGVVYGTGHPAQHRVPWGSAVLTAFAAVGWSYSAMVAVAALGLHLLGADEQGSLGPMTAAMVTMAVGGRVSPSGDVSVFGITGAAASGTIDMMPLGVSLTGALLLARVFLRSLRRAGAVISGGELLARAAAVVVLFVAVLGGLAWAGHSTISINGAVLGDNRGEAGGLLGNLPGIGDLGNLGGGLADSLGNLVKDKASVGFRAETGPSLGGGLVWVVALLAITMLVSRAAPLPPGWGAVRALRPAASALCTVLLVAVLAGLAAALYAAIGDDHPGRVVGGALLGAPNGVWLGATLGLFVPWYGTASGPLALLLPHPLAQLLGRGGEHSVTVARLAGLDGRVWLLTVGAVLMMLAAGVLAAGRTAAQRRAAMASGRHFVGACAGALALAGLVALPLLAWLAGVSANASLSVFGFDAVGSVIALHANLALAAVLGALWGAAAGALGGLVAVRLDWR